MLDLWEPLAATFGFANKSPMFLEKFFASDESLPIVYFLQSVLGVFKKPLLQLQVSFLSSIVSINLLSEINSVVARTGGNCRLFQATDRGAQGK